MRGRSTTTLTGGSWLRSRARLAILVASSPTRSRFWEIFMATVTNRRSLASGALASRCNRHVIDLDFQLVDDVVAFLDAQGELVIALDERAERFVHGDFRMARHREKLLFQFVQIHINDNWFSIFNGRSTETSGHIIFRALLFGTGENLRRRAELDQFAQVEKCCVIGCTRCLLHIMRNDHNRVVFSQLTNQVLNLEVASGSSAEAGSSISSTSGCTASARAMHRRCCWPPDKLIAGRIQTVFHFIPQRRHAQGFLQSARPACARLRTPFNRKPTVTFSPIDMVGNGFDF